MEEKTEQPNNRKLRFEYDITAHCNLNCAGCSHYSPISEKEFVSAEQAEKELTRIGEIAEKHCEIIHIMGGEPLLNPEINEILAIARRAFPKTALHIVTNGILLGSMSPAFWKSCHDNDISIFITVYPVKIQLSKIKAYAKAFNVNVQIFRNGDAFSRYPLSKSGKEDGNASFEYCSMKNCPQFHGGKLYACSLAGCVYKLNKSFDENFIITENDYIDVFGDVTIDDIFAFLSRPISFCRYCNIEAWKKHELKYNWEQSKKEKSEWILPDEETK